MPRAFDGLVSSNRLIVMVTGLISNSVTAGSANAGEYVVESRLKTSEICLIRD